MEKDRRVFYHFVFTDITNKFLYASSYGWSTTSYAVERPNEEISREHVHVLGYFKRRADMLAIRKLYRRGISGECDCKTTTTHHCGKCGHSIWHGEIRSFQHLKNTADYINEKDESVEIYSISEEQ